MVDCHDPIVDVAVVGLPRGERTVVVVDFGSQIESRCRQVVIEDPEGTVGGAGHEERHVFVQGVGAAGVISQGVQAPHVEDTSGALQVARFLTEAVVTVVDVADSVVGDPPGVSPDFIGLGPGGAIFADGDPVVSPALPGHP